MKLDQQLEAILFAAGKPLTARKLADLTSQKTDDVAEALLVLSKRLEEGSGLMLQHSDNEFELVTHPETAEVVRSVVKIEEQGELTRASLEALTILAYRGPMTRPELEQIRGVQSSMILRNLMIRGLVEQKPDERLGQPTYAVTFEFLNHLGLKSASNLPDYDTLRGHAAIADMLEQLSVAEEKTSDNSNSQTQDSLDI